MDNDEGIILPESEVIDHSDAPAPPKPREKKTLVIAIVSVIAILALSVALIIIISQKRSFPPPEANSDPSSTEEKSPILNYDEELFDEVMDEINEFLRVGDYGEAERYLRQYSAVERMTSVQKYRYYSECVLLYSPEHLNDPEMEEKYQKKADEALNSLRQGGK